MARFIVIDHSLRGAGGHHFEYASHVLTAAEKSGFEPILATNQHFRLAPGYRPEWRILPIFRKSTYSRYTVFLRSPEEIVATLQPPSPAPGIWGSVVGSYHGLARRYVQFRGNSRSRSFATGLRSLFRRQELSSGDHVFVPTISEIDLTGLARFLRANPATRVADWHLQFHFNPYHGREPDFARQSAMRDYLRRVMAKALELIPTHRVHFYNTTEQLTSQFDGLGLRKFHTLPYPVNAALRTQQSTAPIDRPPHPLRVTSLGAMRTEKNSQDLLDLLSPIWKSHFENGRCQLVLQSENAVTASSTPATSLASTAPIRWIPHPLPMDAYLDLIRSTDLGLLMYDSVRYYARCSGVLVELLTAGRPVIVSAGCWMSEQLAEANFQHLDQAARVLTHLGTTACGTVLGLQMDQGARESLAAFPAHREDTTATGGRVTIDSGANVAQSLEIPQGSTHALVSFRWKQPSEAGTYLQIDFETEGGEPDTAGPRRFIVGRRREGPVRTMFRVPHGAKQARMTWSNAYDQLPIVVQDARVDFLSAAQSPEGFPLGAVGLVAADSSQLASLVAEICGHWPHYRETAQSFSSLWGAYYNADKLVSELVRRARAGQSRTALAGP